MNWSVVASGLASTNEPSRASTIRTPSVASGIVGCEEVWFSGASAIVATPVPMPSVGSPAWATTTVIGYEPGVA